MVSLQPTLVQWSGFLMRHNIFRKAPFIVALIRMLLAPVFFYTIITNWIILAIPLYILAAVSDVLDGYVARRHAIEAITPYEAYLDPVADFVFVTASFLAFSLRLFYPFVIVFVLVGMFLFFILTSKREEPLYDPMGKYYGIFLILVIGITLLFPIGPLLGILYFLIIAYAIMIVIFRIFFIAKQRNPSESLNPLMN